MDTSFESTTDAMEVSDNDSDSYSESDIDSDSGSDSNSDSEDNANSATYFNLDGNENVSLREELAKHVAMSRSRTKNVNSFLNILSKHGSKEIPKSYSTLMGTPKTKIVEKDVGSGKYFHYGIAKNLLTMESLLKTNIFESLSVINIDIGIDGGTPFNSSKLSLWPIIGALVNMLFLSPFLIGCYAGQGDVKGECTDEY